MQDQRPSESRAHALVRYLTIVPQAHYAVFDADLKMTLFELFHTNRISRVGHAVCTPIVCFSALAALAQVVLPSPLDAPHLSLALPVAALLGAHGYLHGGRIGALTTAVVAMMTLAATLYAAAGIPHALALAVGGMLLAGALQTWSHAFEPVPPPLSGERDFLSLAVWRSQASPGRKLAAAALATTAFIALELLASFRILPCQLRAYALALGRAPSERIVLDRRVTELRTAWPY
ncbi:MAG: hypothetical protein JWP48_1094 [Actinoallomurus sp.]|nr:hypothetical protein [Actinoallomurus sp.]